MARRKGSLILYPSDFIDAVLCMDDQAAGQLFKAILSSHTGREYTPSEAAMPMFMVMENHIERVDKSREKQSINRSTPNATKVHQSTPPSTDIRVPRPNKKNTVFVPPGFEEVVAYLAEKYPSINARQFYDHYAVADWKDVKGLPVLNWKQRAVGWASRDNGLRQKKPIMAPEALPYGWSRDEWGNEYYEGYKENG